MFAGKKSAAGTPPYDPVYVDDVFSTYLYKGNGSTQTIVNNIDLSTKGGLVWIKGRDVGSEPHALFDTARGVNKIMQTNNVDGSANFNNSLTAFNTNGFSLGTNRTDPSVNFVSWTFRKQPKFFDIVTWTGDGSNFNIRTINHSLGSVPGLIIVKATSATSVWWASAQLSTSTGAVRNRTYSSDPNYFALNRSDAYWTLTNQAIYAPTDTTFNLANFGETGTIAAQGGVNIDGVQYIAYLFASDAGGFGTTGSDSIISCGSYVGNGSVPNAQTEQNGPEINVGWEPQWIMIKSASSNATGWFIHDSMRGFTIDQSELLQANNNSTESSFGPTYKYIKPTSTGFKITAGTGAYYNETGETYFYMVIRRPMKVPTVGTSVFSPRLITATQSTQSITNIGFPPDLIINGVRSNANYGQQVTDRLRGPRKQVFTNYDSVENTTNGTALVSLDQSGFTLGSDSAGTGWNAYSGYTSVKWCFKRAASFFDQVCYTGTAAGGRVLSHNLGVAPQLMIFKSRTTTGDNNWSIQCAFGPSGKVFSLNSTGSYNGTLATSLTASSITLSDNTTNNAVPYVAYLFASCPGVSKVGSFTVANSATTVSCGFTPRFVLIKSTENTGTNDWYTFDSARGITSGNDPYLRLNSAAEEDTPLGAVDFLDTTADGFITERFGGFGDGNYIFLAIA
jgi:hypothetical protein